MAKNCDVCGRGSKKSKTRSHSNIPTIRRQNVNLQSKKIDGMSVKICTSCIKTSKKLAQKQTA
jgi:ribosomal protein L28